MSPEQGPDENPTPTTEELSGEALNAVTRKLAEEGSREELAARKRQAEAMVDQATPLTPEKSTEQ